MATDAERMHEHGRALAAADAHLNEALRAAGGDELEAEERLRSEEARPATTGPAPPPAG